MTGSKDNTGYRNTGNGNTGHRNTGHRNTGNGNTGHWNTSNLHGGCFNTSTAKQAYYFNTLCNVDIWDRASKPEWIYEPSPTTWIIDTGMTDKEKYNNPDYQVAEGCLRKNNMADEWQKAMSGATEAEIQQVRDLPCFDVGIFEEITGLDLSIKKPAKCEGKVVVVDGIEYELVEKKA